MVIIYDGLILFLGFSSDNVGTTTTDFRYFLCIGVAGHTAYLLRSALHTCNILRLRQLLSSHGTTLAMWGPLAFGI
jgi:hypothetical protein